MRALLLVDDARAAVGHARAVEHAERARHLRRLLDLLLAHLTPELRPRVIGIRWERTVLRQRITRRLKERLQAGMVDEVAQLRILGIPDATLEAYGLEYRYLTRYLRGELSYNDMVQKLASAIHDFAKRQETWFRRIERQGVLIAWVDGAGDPLAAARHFLRG